MCSDGEEHHELARNQLGAARVIVPFPPPYKRKAQTPTPPIRKQFLLREQLEAMLCSHGKKGILFFTLFFAAAYMSLKQAPRWRKDTEVTNCTSCFNLW